jgi:DNA-binding ferritin-like protein (Dps family)
LLAYLKGLTLSQTYITYLIEKVTKGQELDLEGLKEAVEMLETATKDEISCETVVGDVLSECHARIKHA